MKKYIRITLVLGVFLLLVLLKNLRTFNNADNEVKIAEPSQNISAQSTQVSGDGKYKNGSFTGSVEDAFYGNIQVRVVITDKKIADVIPLQYPNDNSTSTEINTQALSILKQEAIQSQSAHVDVVSGASDSSSAFSRSLASALSHAK